MLPSTLQLLLFCLSQVCLCPIRSVLAGLKGCCRGEPLCFSVLFIPPMLPPSIRSSPALPPSPESCQNKLYRSYRRKHQPWWRAGGRRQIGPPPERWISRTLRLRYAKASAASACIVVAVVWLFFSVLFDSRLMRLGSVLCVCCFCFDVVSCFMCVFLFRLDFLFIFCYSCFFRTLT